MDPLPVDTVDASELTWISGRYRSHCHSLKSPTNLWYRTPSVPLTKASSRLAPHVEAATPPARMPPWSSGRQAWKGGGWVPGTVRRPAAVPQSLAIDGSPMNSPATQTADEPQGSSAAAE